MDTKSNLDEIYSSFGDGKFDSFYFLCNLSLIQDAISGQRVLELSTNIESTKTLSSICSEVVVVDGSKEKIEKVRDLNLHNVTAIHSLFEEYVPEELFDEVIFFRALEHLPNPIESMTYIKSFLSDNGFMTISVPNGHSIHRLVGKELGMLTNAMNLSDDDHKKGHLFVYNEQRLKALLKFTDMKVKWLKGSFIKMTTDSHMKENSFYSPKMLKAIFDASQEVPPSVCAELVARVCIP